MPLVEHLSEMRRRIMMSLGAVCAAFILTFNFSEKIFDLLMFPMTAEISFSLTDPFVRIMSKEAVPLVFLAPAEALWMHLKISFIAAFLLSLPLIFHQVWRFVSPGLLDREKKYLVPFVFFGTGLFIAGAAFCFFVVLPFALSFLLGYKSQILKPMISVGSYIDFCLKFILAFGAIFELPLVIVFLSRMGIVSPAALAAHRKYAVLFAFIIGAVLTPTPDAFNQSLMAVPVIVLYEIGILVSRFVYRKKEDAQRTR